MILDRDEFFMMAATNDRVPCVHVNGRHVQNLDPKDPLVVQYMKENPQPCSVMWISWPV